ncbi:MAG: metal-dependent hydrolase [Bacteroidota bacterium]
MDSLTQFTLGAAMGEATLGKKLGGKAALWGGFFGTLPDLDVLAAPFLTGIEELVFHRGYSHSVLVCTLVSPLLAWPLARRYKKEGTTWRIWTIFLLLTLNTHWMVDSLNTYGTQVGLPFTDYPVSIGSVFFIDPFYTLPLVVGVIGAVVQRRESRGRFWAIRLGLGVSTAYLLLGLGLKVYATAIFERALNSEGAVYEQMITTPSPMNPLLWVAYADEGDAVRVGLYSVLDPSPDVNFQRVDKNLELLADLEESPELDRLWWFTQGFLSVSRQGDQLTVHDLRFGRSDGWLTADGIYVFNFDLVLDPDHPTRLIDFQESSPPIELDAIPWGLLVARILGDPTAEQGQVP